ncbi:MAG TPA: S16 family serine protease [Ktedonobacterales bacterium]
MQRNATSTKQIGLTQAAALVRSAHWSTLSEAERARLLSDYPTLAPRAWKETEPSLTEPLTDTALQDWVAGMLAQGLQTEAVAGIGNWLDTAPPGAHLFVSSYAGSGYGRMSLVASMARAAMAKKAAPPCWAYVPKLDDLTSVNLIIVPRKQARPLIRGLRVLLHDLADGWENATEALVREKFGTLPTDLPAEIQTYLNELASAFVAKLGSELPYDGDDPPAAHVAPDPDEGDTAPVVILTPGQLDASDALLRANGGILIVPIRGPDVTTLIPMLLKHSLTLVDGWPPVPISTRVVLIGTRDVRDQLWGTTEDISRLFRYDAWLGPVVEWTPKAEAAYAAFAGGVTARYALPPVDVAGVARLVQEGARRSETPNRHRLVTDLVFLHDLVSEAGNLAKGRGAAQTTGSDFDEALRHRREVYAAGPRWLRRAILVGESITPTSGKAVGQINALGILSSYSYDTAFAVPIRVTATVNAGREQQLVDVEREAEAVDAAHVRGAMTMLGYLSYRYGQKLPISLRARIRFEQEHNTTGGDSASAAELFAVLSALSDIPNRRSVAITGAVGQYGEVQPIGGVNVKVEGFWELCRARRENGEQITGSYGVIIPEVNRHDLMLRPEIAEAIEHEGWFAIHPVSTVDEAIPLVMETRADVLHRKVGQRLHAYYEEVWRRRL